MSNKGPIFIPHRRGRPSDDDGDGAKKPKAAKKTEKPARAEEADHIDRYRALMENIPFSAPDKYEVIEELGRGGMGVVLEVHDRAVDRKVAMKKIHPEHLENQRNVDSFIKEARVTANLEHPNVVPVHELALDSEATPYYTMKRVRGESLEDILGKLRERKPEYEERYNLARLLEIFQKICDGVSYAHSRGVLHLDLKPENILVGEHGEVMVMDWGLFSFAPGSDAERTLASGPEDRRLNAARKKYVYGSPAYIAPERLREKNRECDQRCDVYSLGSILYAMLTLKDPVKGASAKEMFSKVKYGEVVAPSIRAPERLIPKPLEAIALKAMSLKPAGRYDSVKALDKDINAYVQGDAVSAFAEGLWRKGARFYRRHQQACRMALLTAAFLLASGIAAFLVYQKTQSDWIRVIDVDMSDRAAVEQAFAMMSIQKVRRPFDEYLFHGDAFHIPVDHIIYGRSETFPGNVKVEVLFNWKRVSDIDGLEIAINWDWNSGFSYESGFEGYSAQVGGWKNELCNLSSRHGASYGFNNNLPYRFRDTNVHRMVLTRRDETVSLEVDGALLLEDTDIVPLQGPGHSDLGVHAWSSALALRRVTVYAERMPELASPLEAGHALVRWDQPELALREFRHIAELYDNPDIVEPALAKSIALARQTGDEHLAEMEKNFIRRFPDSRFIPRIEHGRLMDRWRHGDCDAVLDALAGMSDPQRRRSALEEILKAPHKELPEDTGLRLLHALREAAPFNNLNLAEYGLTSLEPLRGLNIAILHCERNRIESLEPLRGMPLKALHCEMNRIRDLSPVADTPLAMLNAGGNPIETLPMFTQRSLSTLEVDDTPIEDIRPLAGLPLTRLSLMETRVRSLQPLASCNTLQTLNIRDTEVEDLSGLPLDKLIGLQAGSTHPAGRSPIRDLERLRDGRLTRLSVTRARIRNADVLSTCRYLVELNLLGNSLTNVQFLQHINDGRLTSLNLSENRIADGEDLKGLKIGRFICHDNPWRSLRFLADMDLAYFPGFFEMRHTREMLVELRDAWSGKGAQAFADEVENLILAFYDKDAEALRKRARRINGRRYIVLAAPVPCDVAMALAGELGAQLADFREKEDFDAVHPLLSPYPLTAFWTGLRNDEKGRPYWSDGIPLEWNIIPMGQDEELYSSPSAHYGVFVGSSIRFVPYLPEERLMILLEW